MYLRHRFYLLMTVTILVMAAGFAVPTLFVVGKVLLVLVALAVVADIVLLWNRRGIRAERSLPERFSNGDANPVRIRVESSYPFGIDVEVIDEIPVVFQRRDVLFRAQLASGGATTIRYELTPTRRGVYGFGRARVFVSTVLGLVQRRFTCCQAQDVKVYPSFLMLRQYELLAMSNQLNEMGIKRIRRIGHNTDFEQIKDYIVGDDYRTINWRATARRSVGMPRLMVNVYQEERSQQVYNVIDKGRMMQQSFAVQSAFSSPSERVGEASMTLLDYAINASLVLSYVAVNKQDKAGLITFSDQFGTFVPASRQPGQMRILQEALYAEQTTPESGGFRETNYSALLAGLSRHVGRRSLLILYTSFTSMAALRRQLPFLRQLSQRHRLLVVYFEDEELRDFTQSSSSSTEQYYQRTIAGKFLYEQRLIAQTLRQYGILSLLTSPRQLSVNVINKYLEIER